MNDQPKVRYYYGMYKFFNNSGLLSEFLFYLYAKSHFPNGCFFSKDIKSISDKYGLSVQRIHIILKKCNEIGLLTRIDKNQRVARYDISSIKSYLDDEVLGKQYFNNRKDNTHRYIIFNITDEIKGHKEFKNFIRLIEIGNNHRKQQYKESKQKAKKLNTLCGAIQRTKNPEKVEQIKQEINELVEWFKKASEKHGQSLNIQFKLSCNSIARILGYKSFGVATNIKNLASKLGLLIEEKGKKLYAKTKSQAELMFGMKFFYSRHVFKYVNLEPSLMTLTDKFYSFFKPRTLKTIHLFSPSVEKMIFENIDVFGLSPLTLKGKM